TGAVREAGVHERRRLVDAPTDLGHDALDDPTQLLLRGEGDRRERESAVLLDVDLVGVVDHDLGDRVVVDQLLDGPQAQGVGLDLGHQGLALGAAEGDGLLLQDHLELGAHVLAQLFVGQGRIVDARADALEQRRDRVLLELVDDRRAHQRDGRACGAGLGLGPLGRLDSIGETQLNLLNSPPRERFSSPATLRTIRSMAAMNGELLFAWASGLPTLTDSTTSVERGIVASTGMRMAAPMSSVVSPVPGSAMLTMSERFAGSSSSRSSRSADRRSALTAETTNLGP